MPEVTPRMTERVMDLLPTDRELWAWRRRFVIGDYAEAISAEHRSVTDCLRRRGWAMRQHTYGKTWLWLAPCRECGTPACVDVAEHERVCPACSDVIHPAVVLFRRELAQRYPKLARSA